MNGSMERAERPTQVWGAAGTGLYLSFYLLSFICQQGRRVAGGTSAIVPARPEAKGILGPVIL